MHVVQEKFLTGLIPETHKEIVFEYPNYYACRIKGPRMTDEDWNKQSEKIKLEFNEQLVEIYSNTCYGVDFIVYLRKDEK